MKVLVLGGNGFIGSHVVDALLDAGHKVRIFDRTEDRYRGRLKNVDYILGSFEDSFMIAEALADIDVVFHGISTTVPGTSNLDPERDIQSNLIGTVKLLRSMLDKGTQRIVYLSSGGTVYGRPTMSPIPESHPLNPVCSYGIVKVAIENYLYMYQELHGLKPIVLRISNPYGERQGHQGVQGVIGTFIHKAQNNEPIEIWGDGSVVRDFIHVDDLKQACLKAVESSVCGVYNVGSGTGFSIKEVLDHIKALTNTAMTVNFSPARGFDVPKVVLDISKVKASLGWQPEIELQEGISKTWAWLANR